MTENVQIDATEDAAEERRADEEWDGYAAAGRGGQLSTGVFTLVVIALLVFGVLQLKYDRLGDSVPGGELLTRAVQLQADGELRAVRDGGTWPVPDWPARFYKRLREDAAFWGLLALAGAWVMVRGERARARRGDYLAWRAARKEVDILRRRISELEKEKGGADGGDL